MDEILLKSKRIGLDYKMCELKLETNEPLNIQTC